MGRDYSAIVIGGGFYGCSIARHLATTGIGRLVILERDQDLLMRASSNPFFPYVQARIAAGLQPR